MAYTKALPNIVTLANLLCGTLTIVQAMEGRIVMACLLLLLATALDFLDGSLARLLKATSAIGKQLDSLADLVSFGLAPFFLIYLAHDSSDALLPAGVFFVCCAAFRLARFNTLPGNARNFVGVPVTLNGPLFPLLTLLQVQEQITILSLIGMGTAMISTVSIPKIPTILGWLHRHDDRPAEI